MEETNEEKGNKKIIVRVLIVIEFRFKNNNNNNIRVLIKFVY